MRVIFIFLLFVFFLPSTAIGQYQVIGGIVHTHGHPEVRFGAGYAKGRHALQLSLDLLLNPKSEPKRDGSFYKSRFAYDSTDRVGIGLGYRFDLLPSRRLKPILGFETQYSPNTMRQNLQNRDGTYTIVKFRETVYWDNYFTAGLQYDLGYSLQFQANVGAGFTRIYGIPKSFKVVTPSGNYISRLLFFGFGICYEIF